MTRHHLTVTVSSRTASGTAGAYYQDEPEILGAARNSALERATVKALRAAGVRGCTGYQMDSGAPGRLTALRRIDNQTSSTQGAFWREIAE